MEVSFIKQELPPKSVGLGLRNAFFSDLIDANSVKFPFDFMELAPENWIGRDGYHSRILHEVSEQFPLICHGLSLSIGGPQPLNIEFLKQIKAFMQAYGIQQYSEHLSFSFDDKGHLYDLFPIPFIEESIDYIVDRIRLVQDILEMPLILEHISYYDVIASEMSEITFINEVLNRSNALLLLDVNNVYVNACNHGYNAYEFLDALPHDKISYLHIAGHRSEADDLKIDTHGEAINESVWDLLAYVYREIGIFPTLLERDSSIPNLVEMKDELDRIRHYQTKVI